MSETDLKQKLDVLKASIATADFILDNITGSLKKFKAVLDDKK